MSIYGLNIQNVSIDTLKETIEELSEKINQETEKVILLKTYIIQF